MTWEQDSFAYADSWDDTGKRYRGLRTAQRVRLTPDGEGLLVKPGVAITQLSAERPASTERPQYSPSEETTPVSFVDNGGASAAAVEEAAKPAPRPNSFHGSVELDPTRIGRDVGRIGEEVVQHLTGLLGSQVKVTFEIHAEVPEGVPESVVGTVTENCRTLRFTSYGFEDEAGSTHEVPAESPPRNRISAPTSDEFRQALYEIFEEARRKGLSSIDVNSGELHRQIGGYPGPDHRMAVCCNVMWSEKRDGDSVIEQPPQGKGANLTIRYAIPRSRIPPEKQGRR